MALGRAEWEVAQEEKGCRVLLMVSEERKGQQLGAGELWLGFIHCPVPDVEKG